MSCAVSSSLPTPGPSCNCPHPVFLPLSPWCRRVLLARLHERATCSAQNLPLPLSPHLTESAESLFHARNAAIDKAFTSASGVDIFMMSRDTDWLAPDDHVIPPMKTTNFPPKVISVNSLGPTILHGPNHPSYPGYPMSASHCRIKNKCFDPDVKELIADIKDALLDATPDCPLTDVVLQTSDNVSIPASKTFLAIRSQYFKNLFFSKFAESNATYISVPVLSPQLRLVVQFIYTADCSLIHQALKYLTPNGHHSAPSAASLFSGCADVPPRTLILDLIDLSVAADYLNVTQLQRLANDTLSILINEFTPITCTALEAMRMYPMALKFCNPLRLWGVTMLNPKGHFLVPDGRTDKQCSSQFSSKMTEIQGSFAALNCNSPKMDPKYGVLELSAETLDSLLRLCTSGSDHEYLFQVIYCWATNGRSITKKPSLVIKTFENATQSLGKDGNNSTILRNTNSSIGPNFFGGRSRSSLQRFTLSQAQSSHKPLSPAIPDNNNSQKDNSDNQPSSSSKPDITDSQQASSNDPDDLLTANHDTDEHDKIQNPFEENEHIRSERWARAEGLVKNISLKSMNPEFIRDFVEASKLVSFQALFEAYKSHALK